MPILVHPAWPLNSFQMATKYGWHRSECMPTCKFYVRPNDLFISIWHTTGIHHHQHRLWMPQLLQSKRPLSQAARPPRFAKPILSRCCGAGSEPASEQASVAKKFLCESISNFWQNSVFFVLLHLNFIFSLIIIFIVLQQPSCEA